MDKKLEIQLGIHKNVNSINVDNYDKIELLNTQNELLEYDIRNVLSVTEVYENERQNTEVYRIYGGLEWISTLNRIIKEYKEIKDFFEYNICELHDNSCEYKNILDSFDFYLVRPKYFEKITNNGITYIRKFEVIATPDDFELLNAGYYKNLYGDKKYSFIFNKDFDISEMRDEFGFPITELFLHPRYKKSQNGLDQDEETYKIIWDINTGTETIESYEISELNIGDIIYGDKIEYSESTFKQFLSENQEYFIDTPYKTKILRWKYNPFISIKLRHFSNELKRANTGSTSYDQVVDIPNYATHLGNGNMVWRKILPQGYIDPLTGNGVDYPFINKKRYLFTNIIFDVIPDLSHNNTLDVFRNINFENPTSINLEPKNESDLNNIGKPC